MRAEQVTEPVAYHGEGPVWSERWGGLRWVDMLAGDVLSLAPDGEIGRRHVGSVAAAIRPRRRGGAVHRRGAGLRAGGRRRDARRTSARCGPTTGVRMNEGGCDPDGRFYCGSMAYDKRPGAGALYRLDPDGSVRVVLDERHHLERARVEPGRLLRLLRRHADAPYRRLRLRPRIRIDRAASLRRTIPAEAGHPDGLTVDAQGGVWVALFGGGAVRRYTPEGVLDGVVEVPARKVTACTFGGPRLDQLFITTSREGLEPGIDPLAGSLFRVVVGVVGLPVASSPGEPARRCRHVRNSPTTAAIILVLLAAAGRAQGQSEFTPAFPGQTRAPAVQTRTPLKVTEIASGLRQAVGDRVPAGSAACW